MLKSWIKTTARQFGYEIRKIPPPRGLYDQVFADAFRTQHFLLSRIGITQPTIFDVGAHYGETAQHYRAYFPQAAIYCFEPCNESFVHLCQAAESDPGIKPVHTALGDKPGVADLRVCSYSGSDSIFPRPVDGRRYFRKDEEALYVQSSPVTTIDTFIEKAGIERIDILKLDIEGSELLALCGAVQALEIDLISLIYLEVQYFMRWQDTPVLHTVWQYLERYGYSLFDVYNIIRARTNGQIQFSDALFVSRTLRERVLDQFEEEP